MTSYQKFGFMMIVSFIIMYVVMFLNIASFDHFYLSTTRTYMTVLMVAPMAISMLLFMWGMYKNIKLNIGLIISAILIFSLTLFGLRTQQPIGDVQWMKAMIPHHSSAILTSSNTNFTDPKVKKLANEIVKVQKEEIALMKEMIRRLEKKSSNSETID